ncbi:MAG: peptide deformylase [bacterium]
MPVRKVVQIGNEIIRGKSRTVIDVDNREVKQTIKDLVDSMRRYNLVGLAAPQIGKSLRIFVTEIRKTTYRKNVSKEDQLRVFINPRVIEKSKHTVNGYEGCGSVISAKLFGVVKRARTVAVTALDAQGKRLKLKADGLLACVIQHEMDHLDGIVFLDRVTDTRGLLDREVYIKLQRH